ncbi:GerAB/ArcD/ProY family transporter [Xylanibacillus composti]|uniref:Germination protein n=1 Tax=Xylanibacillus composti TaxID=1572762 RepID=A0A8J4M2R8_9BACL|nr:endospore germination permease [Xylanibacillus composti]GIQ69217.1 germination protein [Xylanibacillus composti]
MRTERISIRQFAWMVTVLLVGTSLFTLTRQLPRIASQDAWLSYILPAIYAFAVAALFSMLAARYPGKNIFEIAREAAGRWAGGALNGLLIAHFLLIAIRDLKLIAFFSQSTLLGATPIEIILFLLVLATVYYASLSIEDHARVIELIFPFMVLFTLITPFLLTGDMNLSRLEPFLVVHPGRLGMSSLIQAASFGDLLIMGAFLHTLARASAIHVALRKGILISTILLTAILLLIINVLGEDLASDLTYPAFTMIEQLQLTDFLDRLEIFILFVWVPFATMKSVLTFAAILYGLSSFFGHRSMNRFHIPLGLLLLFASYFSFDSVIDVFAFSMLPNVLNQAAVQIVLFGILLLAVLFRRTAGSSNDTDHASPGLVRTTALLLAAAAILLPALFLAKTHAWVGDACALGYVCLLLLAFASSYSEVREVKKIE